MVVALKDGENICLAVVDSNSGTTGLYAVGIVGSRPITGMSFATSRCNRNIFAAKHLSPGDLFSYSMVTSIPLVIFEYFFLHTLAHA